MLVTFHEAAFAELQRAVERYNTETPGLGDALAREVQTALKGITEFPEAGFQVRPNVRRRLLPRFRYSLLYNVVGERLRVLALMHWSQAPDYWNERL